MSKNKKYLDQIENPRILIVGGVAGGASCAARARRLSEKAGIVIFERGQHISFASCGLPYYIGDVISQKKDLLVATPRLFRDRFNIDVRIHYEVVEIERDSRKIWVRNLQTGKEYHEHYDALVLATGAVPFMPPVPGADLPGILTLRTIPDSQKIKQLIQGVNKKAVIVGGGAIGLETAENLVKAGVTVTIIDILPQVMPALDPEMAVEIQNELAAHKVTLHLGDGVVSFKTNASGKSIITTTGSGLMIDSRIVLLSTGVKPDAALARKSGLEIGKLGGIRVDEQMRTSDPNIWAVGDVAEVKNFITGEWSLLPLAGPASRQGRTAADAIFGRSSKFRGVQGTTVCKVFDKTAAATGLNEKTLQGMTHKLKYEKIYLHPNNHAGYYPGANPITMKILFSTENGKILGAQAVGNEGTERRIDVIAMAIQKGSTVYDLEEAEMCYAPQFSSSRDPVNIAGMAAANMLRGDSPVIHWEQLENPQYHVLDVRQADEFNSGHIEGAQHIPLPSLRKRLGELPKDRVIAVYCAAGQRSYYATRLLKQNGFTVKNISGGITTYKHKSVTRNVKTGYIDHKK